MVYGIFAAILVASGVLLYVGTIGLKGDKKGDELYKEGGELQNLSGVVYQRCASAHDRCSSRSAAAGRSRTESTGQDSTSTALFARLMELAFALSRS